MQVTVDNLIKLVLPWPGVGDTLAQLSQLPFTIASSSGLAGMFHGPSFSDGHRGHGLLAAFQGAGHQRLVSRRWLDHGPWATLHGPNDTTWVFFYDPDEPEADQLDRAKHGHRWMGISNEGGFLQSSYVYAGDLDVRYDAELQLIRQLVHGKAPEPTVLRDLCAARAFQALGPDRPIQRVALVFMSETQARESLHDLWLREIECWALIQGREVRLDEDYEPPPKPAWARSLEQRYGTAHG